MGENFINYLVLSLIFFGGLAAIAYMHWITRDVRRQLREQRDQDRAHPAE